MVEKLQHQVSTTYTYDAHNRLSGVEYPGAREELYYDRAGNCTKRCRNGMEELYRYDTCNHLLSHTKEGVTTEYTYDRAGKLTRDSRVAYTYDAFNRTVRVETFDGNIQIKYYDAEGLLIPEVRKNNTASPYGKQPLYMLHFVHGWLLSSSLQLQLNRKMW